MYCTLTIIPTDSYSIRNIDLSPANRDCPKHRAMHTYTRMKGSFEGATYVLLGVGGPGVRMIGPVDHAGGPGTARAGQGLRGQTSGRRLRQALQADNQNGDGYCRDAVRLDWAVLSVCVGVDSAS